MESLSRDVLAATSISVRVDGARWQRDTQAVVADIARVDLVLSQTGQPDRTQSIDKSLVGADGSATATFDRVWPGDATISAQVLDSSGASIGSVSASAVIQSGKTTAISLPITLVPTIVVAP